MKQIRSSPKPHDVPNFLDDSQDDVTKKMSVDVLETFVLLDDPPRNVTEGDVPESTHISDDPPLDADQKDGDVPEANKVSQDLHVPIDEEHKSSVEILFEEVDMVITGIQRPIEVIKFMMPTFSKPQDAFNLQSSSEEMEDGGDDAYDDDDENNSKKR